MHLMHSVTPQQSAFLLLPLREFWWINMEKVLHILSKTAFPFVMVILFINLFIIVIYYLLIIYFINNLLIICLLFINVCRGLTFLPVYEQTVKKTSSSLWLSLPPHVRPGKHPPPFPRNVLQRYVFDEKGCVCV